MKMSKLSSESHSAEGRNFQVLLCLLDSQAIEVAQSAEIVYRELSARGLRVLFDDRNLQATQKLERAREIGLPVVLKISEASLLRGQIELLVRSNRNPLNGSRDEARHELIEDIADITLEVVNELAAR